MNSKEITIQQAMNVLRKAMRNTEPGSYAHGWHCNIACVCADAIAEMNANIAECEAFKIGNKAATTFMKLAFDVETNK